MHAWIACALETIRPRKSHSDSRLIWVIREISMRSEETETEAHLHLLPKQTRAQDSPLRPNMLRTRLGLGCRQNF